jgi:alanine dehydrogenase
VIIGIPREIKPEERRVSVTPEGVKLFLSHGHHILIEQGAGQGCGIPDSAYRKAGAAIKTSSASVWGEADMVIKVKEPIPAEIPPMREKQVVFAFLHLAANRQLTRALLKKKVIGIAYETVQLKNGSLPILKPMSEIAGHLSAQLGARGLEVIHGGQGILMGCAHGVAPARVTIIGGGSAGCRAGDVAFGMGARVTILELKKERVKQLRDWYNNRLTVKQSTPERIEDEVVQSDVVIGAVLNPGARAPQLITRDMVRKMKKGSVIVDIAIDQGGCCETTRPTSQERPFYLRYGIVHCGITNLPSIVPLTSTRALTKVSLPYALEIADKGYLKAVRDNPSLMKGVTVMQGKVTNRAVANACKLLYHPL